MIWEVAGVIGIDPLPLTLRELMWMARAREENLWTKVSHLMASSLNANPFRREEVGSADDVFDAMARDGFTSRG